MPAVDVVVPTIGRPSLDALLASLAVTGAPGRILLVDDRPGDVPALDPAVPGALRRRVTVLRGAGRGPAAARNVGWRAAATGWVAFLDDDVEVAPTWAADLAEDLRAAGPTTAASQGRITVPAPAERRHTDWERNTAGLEGAAWATADMAFRREALVDVGGFDERFPRAYREDADLALRLQAAGWSLARGRRRSVHPVRPAGFWVSVRLQRGNADDPLMRALHGRGWRTRASVPAGRRPRHVAVTSAAIVAGAAAAAGRRRAAATWGAVWAAGTAELARARIAPGPRTADEIVRMVATSMVMPFAATLAWLRGVTTVLLRRPQPLPAGRGPGTTRVRAVLFDRDGTLVVDEPYNGDPEKVRLMPGAREAVDRLRSAGLPIAVVSNQSGIGRGMLTPAQVEAVNRRVEQLLGPIDAWHYCPHVPADGCGCRKPAPGMVRRAAESLGVEPSACALIGDIGADVEAALAAGAWPVLVPTRVTRPQEVADAPEVAVDLSEAVSLVLGEES